METPPGNRPEALIKETGGTNSAYASMISSDSVSDGTSVLPWTPRARATAEDTLSKPLEPLGISINRLAWDIVVPPGRISGIVNGKRGISAHMARWLVGAEVEKRVHPFAA